VKTGRKATAINESEKRRTGPFLQGGQGIAWIVAFFAALGSILPALKAFHFHDGAVHHTPIEMAIPAKDMMLEGPP